MVQIKCIYFILLLWFLLFDMLKMYETKSFFYVDRGIFLLLKLLGQNILLFRNPLLHLSFLKEKMYQNEPGSMSCISFDQSIFSERNKSTVRVLLC